MHKSLVASLVLTGTLLVAATGHAQNSAFAPANSIVVSSSSRSTNGQLIYRLSQQVGGLQVYGVSAKAATSCW